MGAMLVKDVKKFLEDWADDAPVSISVPGHESAPVLQMRGSGSLDEPKTGLVEFCAYDQRGF